MSNNGRTTVCPFYRNEKNLSISCEDTFHRFRWPAQKKRHMDTFCDKDWKSCPYAVKIMKIYEGDTVDNIKELKIKLEETQKELRKTASMLGKAEKREKKKDEKLRELQRAVTIRENQFIASREREQELMSQVSGIAEDFVALDNLYQDRLAFLMAASGKKFAEKSVKEFTDKYDYSIVPEEGEDRVWRLELEKKDDKHRGSSSENEETGRGEACEAGEAGKTGEKAEI